MNGLFDIAYEYQSNVSAAAAPPEPTTNNSDTLRDAIEAHIATHYADIIANEDRHGTLYRELVMMIEAPLLSIVLRETRGNQVQAAKALGLSRGTLRKKLKDHRLVPT